MKKIFLFLFSLVFGFGLLLWVMRFVGLEQIRSLFEVFSGWHGIVILILSALVVFFSFLKWWYILKNQGQRISFGVLVSAFFGGFSITFLAPMIIFGGELFRAYILKAKGLSSAPHAYASVIIDRIIDLTVYLVIILFGVIFFISQAALLSQKYVFILSGTIFFLASLLIVLYFKMLKKESIINIFVQKIEKDNKILETEREIFDFFRADQKEMWICFGLAIFRSAVVLLRSWLLIYFLLAKPLSLLSVFSVSAFYYLAYMMPIPAALGSHDAIQAIAFNVLGWGAEAGTVFALIIRAAELAIALFGLLFLFRLGLSILEMNLLDKLGRVIGKVKNKGL